MSKQIKLIDSREVLGKQFNIYGDFENPLFLAKDVSEWIEYSDGNVSHMCSMLDEDEIIKIYCEIPESNNGTKPIKSSGFANRLFVTEDGLFEILMQSRKPIAKEFKKQVKEILKVIRKTGGYVANTRMFVDTYFSTMDEAGKEFLVQTLDKKLQIEQELKKAKEEIEYKSEIIEGFVENLDIYKKRDIINRIVKSGGFGYATRYTEIYKTFKELYHIDLKARAEGYNTKVDKKKDKLSVIQYAEKFGHIDNIYNVVVKLYETEVNKILKDIYNITK